MEHATKTRKILGLYLINFKLIIMIKDYSGIRTLKLYQSRQNKNHVVAYLIMGRNRMIIHIDDKLNASPGQTWKMKIETQKGKTYAKAVLIERVEIMSSLHHFGGGKWGVEFKNLHTNSTLMKLQFPQGDELNNLAMELVSQAVKQSNLHIFKSKLRRLYRENFQSYLNRMSAAEGMVNRIVSDFMGDGKINLSVPVDDAVDIVSEEAWKYMNLKEIPCSEPSISNYVKEIVEALKEDLTTVEEKNVVNDKSYQ